MMTAPRSQNGNLDSMGISRSVTFDPGERYAALDERVTNLRSSLVALEHSTSQGFAAMGSQIGALSNEIRGASKTPWGVIWSAIGVAFAVLGGVGWLAYAPINDNVRSLTDDLKDMTKVISDFRTSLPDNFITRNELVQRTERAAQDRDTLNATLAALPSTYVSRYEWNEALGDVKHRLERIEAARP